MFRPSRALNPSGKETTKKVDDLITYFTDNSDRMDYPSYRTQRLRYTSGTDPILGNRTQRITCQIFSGFTDGQL